jgi:hypothetical protein
MSETEDAVAIINLLAGAAQAGEQGALARAALNLMQASEAVAMSRRDEQQNEETAQTASELLSDARKTFFELAQDPAALEEGKQNILNAKGKVYQSENSE